MRAAILLTPGSVVSLVAAVHDLLLHCMTHHIKEGAEVDLLYGVSARDSALLQDRFSFIRQYDVANAPRPDWLFVPALMVDDSWEPCRHGRLASWLRDEAASGTRIVGVGTGAFLLAEAGLFPGGKAVTHSRYAALFQRNFPALQVVAEPGWVEEGAVICSGDLPWQELVLRPWPRPGPGWPSIIPRTTSFPAVSSTLDCVAAHSIGASSRNQA